MLWTLTFAALLGSGLMAGLFFVFSVTIMTALGRLPAPAGIAAMQSINATILNPLILGAVLGTAVLCLILAVSGSLWPEPGAPWLIAGAASYLAGVIAVTMICNVPMNNALAAEAPDSAGAHVLWQRYLSVWTRWNHLRTAASILAMACFALAMR